MEEGAKMEITVKFNVPDLVGNVNCHACDHSSVDDDYDWILVCDIFKKQLVNAVPCAECVEARRIHKSCKSCIEMPDDGTCEKCGDTLLTTKDRYVEVRKGSNVNLNVQCDCGWTGKTTELYHNVDSNDAGMWCDQLECPKCYTVIENIDELNRAECVEARKGSK